MKGKWSQRQGLGEHTCIRQCTTGAEKGGGDVCGTQECDRTASPALTSDAVRSGAVLPCSGGPEHQATGAFPQPTDNTHGASHRLTELSEENGDTRSRKEIRLTPFFNTHRQFRHRRIAGQRNGLRSVECAIGDPDRGNPDTGGGGCEDHTDGTGGTGCHAATAVARGGGGNSELCGIGASDSD